MKKMSLFVCLMAFTGLLFTSCGSSKNLFRDQDPVPADFGKEPTTVLVVTTEQNKVNKALADAFDDHYEGAYEVVDAGQVNSNKYSDTKKYRYAFRTVISFAPATGMGQTRNAASNNYTYYVLDRVTGKRNGLDFVGGAYKGLMEAYVKKMEEVRKSNSK